ncbi:cytochrome P450 [Nocardia brasiliensis]|uniref:cytochrome P450 n=1 Tax=Nocardia brasiliensis TaxID=37326 RepID=UPI002454D89A|nr:cytochrome P450 [Nocardia brasiliensis]
MGEQGATVRVATAPHRLPVLGHLLSLRRDPLGFMASLPAHGELVRIGLGPVTAVVVCDPELTQQMLRQDRIFDKGGPQFDRGRELVGHGLATCPYAMHRRQRRLLQPAFHADRITGYAPMMTYQITEMVDSWRDGEVIDVKAQLHTLAAKVTAATLFGQAMPESDQQRLLHDVEVVFAGVIRQAMMPEWVRRWPVLGNRACLRAAEEARAILGELVAARRAEGVDHGDLCSALVMARDNDGGQLSDAEIVDQVLTFFFAGTDTTATALAWALIQLDRHPEVAARLHAEVDAVLAGAAARHGDLPRLPFTGRVIAETLRLRPPAWLSTRTVTEDTELGGHPLPAGSTVIFSSYLIQHRPDLYPDPERFDPDRFDPARPEPPRDAQLAFAAGARKCIGDRYALTEATLALATIATRWRLRSLRGTDIRPTLAVVPEPRRLRMRATARSPRSARAEEPGQLV